MESSDSDPELTSWFNELWRKTEERKFKEDSLRKSDNGRQLNKNATIKKKWCRCSFCNRVFLFEKLLHKRIIINLKLYECCWCHSEFQWKFSLINHRKKCRRELEESSNCSATTTHSVICK
ncbi:CLUMA_CG013903, isoform A [Clunio marinus]|uniref:CLUMA_CG013903, isoform A n=1 Tax=Clunio marinus TaxID=568069 RepID=A0A1J1IK83_9DIPT|nr:CLUMA_CG013903, isoform A [Clunio marinus]